MTTPHISAPTLAFPAELRSNPDLTCQIRILINNAFRRSKLPDPDKWDLDRPRFPTNESYYEQLGEEAVVALIFDHNIFNNSCEHHEQASEHEEGKFSGKVIACAAAVPWKGGWAKEGAGKEVGWEIKAVAVHEDPNYLHKGLAVKAMKALEEYLVEDPKVKKSVAQKGGMTLWLLVAECINGVYWRKRGYHEVRRNTEGAGTWGCKTSFDLVVYCKDVEIGIADKSP
ncbi:hypothetical protein DE146DRAFT_642217 [Phaeosphaeria sp. MPI-PUGE-AT-0046c]|nr:hypothetical protein DE146DRAFT_642217 [Phaeosphaeria sp. MPI-PUGE-AT-0046c]